MRSSNPVLNSLAGSQQQPQYYGEYGAQVNTNLYHAPIQTERPMTVDDVVTKTGLTLGVIIAFALVTFAVSLVSLPLALGLTMIGMIGGFVTVLIATFGKKYNSAPVTLAYAAFEGLFVGGFSLLVSGFSQGSGNAGSLIGQAILGTLGVFVGMLYAYKSGAVKVTPRFTKMLTGAIVGVAILALGNFIFAMFGFGNALRDGGVVAIGFSLVCIGLAAMSFLQDFDVAEKLIRQGAPAKNAWGVALGLAVTVVWLYTEILRLLSYFNRS
ncbi:Bax inhibitor-1/YccA family protein [Corynebacterium sp. HS2168-gen11]|uniref:Bax inhibitor-1/YccA family protein n=1 Tax=Corynebacterium sp. HS2168-gen11 TaxID=2974027 RepID=UPI00216B23F2|nr:Bax inhibitor-1/YccA family protein [Corynebacterium sp. HS2168-gen11]MCS4534983.1 Bax inhibitor-1/YccA family protein [Corynebacterium sp. HS2168-gen11]